MRNLFHNQILFSTKEEEIPGYTLEFPYLASKMHFAHYEGEFVPWHWHHALELFYVEKGTVVYSYPGGTMVFEEGTAGLLNSNVMHSTRPQKPEDENIQLVELFAPEFIGGAHDGRVFRKYVEPIVSKFAFELLKFDRKNVLHRQIIKEIYDTFYIDKDSVGYELILREKLSKVWIQILGIIDFQEPESEKDEQLDNHIKLMIQYVHENFRNKITVSDIAAAGFTSERGCYRIFNEYLHTTPSAYIFQCRMREAIHMLTEKNYSVLDISIKCGFGDSSHFAKLFKKETGFTPAQYRKNAQRYNVS